jgi:hypothetical protein
VFGFSETMSKERHDFCEQLASVFRAATWNSTCVSVDSVAWYPKEMKPGILVQSSGLPGHAQLADSIVAILNVEHLSASRQVVEWTPGDGLCIAAAQSGDRAAQELQCWRFQIVLGDKPAP